MLSESGQITANTVQQSPTDTRIENADSIENASEIEYKVELDPISGCSSANEVRAILMGEVAQRSAHLAEPKAGPSNESNHIEKGAVSTSNSDNALTEGLAEGNIAASIAAILAAPNATGNDDGAGDASGDDDDSASNPDDCILLDEDVPMPSETTNDAMIKRRDDLITGNMPYNISVCIECLIEFYFLPDIFFCSFSSYYLFTHLYYFQKGGRIYRIGTRAITRVFCSQSNAKK